MKKQTRKSLNQVQIEAIEFMENQLSVMKFTKIQALTMALQYHKGEYFVGLSDSDFEVVVKYFVEEYF